ncbi:hypothetical protein QCA50_013721 [Cerrena zonata]|uniref:Uncharacterized protein n=1 Tax=Cerrena zonata TaxID=2478898 RepID=A0AAW0FXY2_9APHY
MSNVETNTTSTVVDDLSFDIHYTAGWYYQPSDGENGGGSHMTNRTGSQAVFQFNGTGIEVWGTIGAWNVVGIPTSQYELTNQTVVKYRPPSMAPGVKGSKSLFYRSPILEYGPYTIKIINLGNETHDSIFGFDYFIYSIKAPSSTSDPSPSSTADSPSSGKTWPVSAIAGGISAIVFVFIVICGVAVYFIIRRHRQKYIGNRLLDISDGSSVGHGSEMSHLRVDPFLPPSYDEAIHTGSLTPTSTLPSLSPVSAKRLMS